MEKNSPHIKNPHVVLKTHSTFPILIMGLSSILLQIISIRKLLTVFSGNELDIGITLSVWLTAVGAGSYAGRRFRAENAFAFSFIAIALLSQPTILSMSLIRPLMSAEFGETISLSKTLISTVFSLLPLCFIAGLQFPLSVLHAAGNAPKAYAIEAAGAFIGGVAFTLLLSGRADAFVISMAVSIMNIAVAILLLKRRALILLLLIPVLFYVGALKIDTMLRWKKAELMKRIESRYGEITVLKIRDDVSIYASNKFQFSYPDPQTEEIKAYLIMSVHPSSAHFSILIIGGSPAVVREFLKYPASRIDFIELDPKMVDVSFSLLSPADRKRLNDSRLRIIASDARRFIKASQPSSYDLIVMNVSEPVTANINRLYTADFFREAENALKKGGVISLNLPTSSGYIGRRMQMANGSVYNSLRSVFRYVAVSSEEYGYMFASDSPLDIDPHALHERFSVSNINTEFFKPYIFYDAFSPVKINMVKERLERVKTINKDLHPIAYLYNLMLWADIHGGKALNYILALNGWQMISVIIALFAAVAACLWRRKKAVYYSMFTTGFSAMAFSLTIILTYQTMFGYVYEMVGLLTALFMLGLSIGAYIAKDTISPLRWLRFFEVVIIALIVSASLFFTEEPAFYLLSLLCGMIAGIQFTAATLYIKEEDRTVVAGGVYATDLIGSFSGAFMTAILLIPLLGIQNTLFLLAFIKTISLAILLSLRHEKN